MTAARHRTPRRTPDRPGSPAAHTKTARARLKAQLPGTVFTVRLDRAQAVYWRVWTATISWVDGPDRATVAAVVDPQQRSSSHWNYERRYSLEAAMAAVICENSGRAQPLRYPALRNALERTSFDTDPAGALRTSLLARLARATLSALAARPGPYRSDQAAQYAVHTYTKADGHSDAALEVYLTLLADRGRVGHDQRLADMADAVTAGGRDGP